jgi:signal transduction histidine kinase
MSIQFPELHGILQQAFHGIPEREAEDLVSSGDVVDFPVDTVLCKEGEIEEDFYIILDGSVEVTKVINEDEARLLKHLNPGDFFGEMGLIHNAPRAATVKTISPTKVLVINKSAFDHLLERSTSVSLAMVREVSRRLRENDEMAIEDLRLKARELALAYQQLAEQEFARREFLTSIGHELRTPLTAASGFLELARKRKLDEQTLEMALDTVSRNIQQIISLVNDILFLQEVELVFPDLDPTDMGQVVTSAVETQRERAKRNKVRFYLEIAPDLPLVSGHFKSLERAIDVILDNAIKFSPNGGEVRIRVEPEGEYVKTSVTDQGVGIPEEALPYIFDRYYRMDEIGDYLFDGLGLGLAITHQVIEQHGGRIEVQSYVDQGSTFSIYLEICQGDSESSNE